MISKRWIIGIFVIFLIVSGCSRQGSGLHTDLIESYEIEKIEYIRILYPYEDPASLLWLEKVLSQYEALHKNIKFRVESVSEENYKEILQKYYASGNIPDLYFVNNLKDVTYFVDTGFAIDITQEAFLRTNVEWSALNSVSYKDKVWAVPIQWQGFAVFYNKDIFLKSGVQIPETLDEFIFVCETLKKKGFTPITGGFKESKYVLNDLKADISQSGYINNTDWRISIEKNLYLWEDNFFRFREALERFDQRLQYYDNQVFDMNWVEATEHIAYGQAAMVIGGFEAVMEIMNHNQDVELGMFPFPWSNDIAKNNLPIKTDKILIANAYSKNSESLVDILNYFSSNDVAIQTQLINKSLSVNRSIEKNDVAAFDGYFNYIEEGKKVDFSSYKSEFESDELEKIFKDTIVRFIYNPERNVSETILYLDQEFQKIISNDEDYNK